MRQTTDDQLEAIWSAAQEGDIAPNAWRGVDQWGNEITIFGSWREVEQIAEVVYTVLPQEMIDEYQPTFANRHYEVDKRHHIEWAIGDFGFDDQYSTCSSCGVAIDIHDYHPRHYVDYDASEITCADCIAKHYADEYLAYCARHMADNIGEIARDFVEPSEYGYILLNPYSGYGEYAYSDCLIKYDGLPNFPLNDHPDLPHDLSYADRKGLARLAKSNRLVDDNIMLFAQYRYSGYLFWAKFENDQHDDPIVNLAILNYGITRIFAKYNKLRMEGK